MYDPQDDDTTREADAVDATDMAPTVMSGPGSGEVVDAFAWSQEDGSAEPAPYVDDYYDHEPSTGRRLTAPPATAAPGRRQPAQWPRIAVGVGTVVALIAVAGALYSLARTGHEETPDAPVTSTAVVPPLLSSSLPPSTPQPPPVVTTAPPPQTTTVPPSPTTTTPPPSTTTTTTAPPSTTTTTTPPPPTTTTAPPTSSEPPTTTAPPTTAPHRADDDRIPHHPVCAGTDTHHSPAELAANLPRASGFVVGVARRWPDGSGAGTLDVATGRKGLAMGDNGAFGFDSEDLDRMMREAGEGLRAAFGRFSASAASPRGGPGWGAVFADLARAARPESATTGETGDGVWTIYTVGDDGAARVEQVYASEIDALRASQRNPDPQRRVRFLPYGIAVGVLDDSDEGESGVR